MAISGSHSVPARIRIIIVYRYVQYWTNGGKGDVKMRCMITS